MLNGSFIRPILLAQTKSSRRFRSSPAPSMDECGSESREVACLAGTAPPRDTSRPTHNIHVGIQRRDAKGHPVCARIK